MDNGYPTEVDGLTVGLPLHLAVSGNYVGAATVLLNAGQFYCLVFHCVTFTRAMLV